VKSFFSLQSTVHSFSTHRGTLILVLILMRTYF